MLFQVKNLKQGSPSEARRFLIRMLARIKVLRAKQGGSYIIADLQIFSISAIIFKIMQYCYNFLNYAFFAIILRIMHFLQ